MPMYYSTTGKAIEPMNEIVQITDQRSSGTGRHNRLAFTMLELIVALVMLLAIMTFVTTLCFRINLVWKDVAQYRLATAELSNHLDRLTRLETVKLPEEIGNLSVSDRVAKTLPEAVMTGTLADSELGMQITLSLQWRRRHSGKPLELVGWVPQRPKVAVKNGDAVKAEEDLP